MDKVLNLYKKRGETPLECIHRYKMVNAEYADTPMTYAGRLDPLAEGVLVVLSGEKVHTKEEYLALPKEYSVDVLFGASTDTYDLLGMATELSVAPLDISYAEERLKEFAGRHTLTYPPYSSKPVKGKPLFAWARSGNLESIDLPTREVDIYELECESWKEISAPEMLEEIISAIDSVRGDFRQDESIAQWQKLLEGKDYTFSVARIRVSSSSGAYMRSLAHEWGKSFGLPALAYKIIRTRVGDFEITKSLL